MKKLKLQVKAFLLKLKAILTLPINQLIIFSALVFILSILMALSIIYFNHSKTFKLDNLGAIGSLLQGTLGIAVSLAGAYVAIKLAGLGYDILNKENKRDDYVIINDIVSSAINPIFKIAQEYEKLIDIFRKISDDDKFQRNIREVLEQAIEDSDFEIKPDDYKPKISNTLEADNDKDERDKKEIIPDLTFMNELGNQVSNLKGALEDIRSNQFSYFMFRELIDKNAKKSLLLKHSEPVVADDFNKLVFYLKSFEKLIDRKIKNPQFNDLYIPYISLKQTTKLDLKNFIIDGELKLEEIPDSYKIMALGLIICRRSAKISADFKIEEYEYSNLGGAVLRDLANILLQEVKVYRDILKDILEGIDLGDLTKSPLLRILELEEKNNNNLWFSTSLSSAINEIKNGKFEFSFKMKKIKSQSNDSESV